ncbi:MAG: ComF family protein [Firmicutes bacterium]|nr:ComF family protein [Bacillota bacterium]
MRYRLRQLWHSCLDLLFPPPPRCFFCQRPLSGQSQIWLACLQSISHAEGPLCRRCGRPLPAQAPCTQCMGKNWAFSQARSVGPYAGQLRLAVHRLKFHNRKDSSRLLARLMFQSIEASWWSEVHALVPVPLHSERMRQRGYNQAQLLAYELSILSGRPMLQLLERILPTPAQTGLSQRQRRLNMRGAFRVVAERQQELQGKCLLLVDDVLTTGSTLDACARALRQAGCREVRAVTVAITDLED